MRSLLLLSLLLTLSVGQFGATALVLVRHQRGQRRAEALRTRTRNGEGTVGLTHLTVPAAELNGSGARLTRVGRREVRFGGHLYDVVLEEQRGDTLHLWIHWDREEETAVGQLAEAFEGAARPTGIAPIPPPLANLHLLYLFPAPATLHPPFPGRIPYALADARTAGPPFDDVPHPPPRG